jgi:hypothetical protein
MRYLGAFRCVFERFMRDDRGLRNFWRVDGVDEGCLEEC